MIDKRFISSGFPYEALAGYSRAVVRGQEVFVSGTVGYDPAIGGLVAGAAAQAERAIDTIERALNEANGTLLDVVRVRVFIPDRADVDAICEVVRRRLGPSRAANTTICSALAVDGAKVEIEVDARVLPIQGMETR